MRRGFPLLMTGLALAMMADLAIAQEQGINLPKSIEAGSVFSVRCSGSGEGTVYIVGPGQVLRRDVQLGSTTSFPAGSLTHAGRYLAILSASGSSSDAGSNPVSSFDVVPASEPAKISFLARPSRLPVDIHDAITGAVYLFDTYQNLILTPMPVSFDLTNPSGAGQKRSVTTRDGAAWTAMDSSAHDGTDHFVASAGDVSSARAVVQVAGDACNLRMSVTPSDGKLVVATDPVRDCSGNAVPDGTIVTFTEAANGSKTTVDVPLKRGIAKVEMPEVQGAIFTVASGVSLGNQVRWEK